MYRNLRAEIARTGLTLKMIADDGRIGCNMSTLSTKLNGHYDFTLKEAVTLKKVIGSQLPLEELFKDED